MANKIHAIGETLTRPRSFRNRVLILRCASHKRPSTSAAREASKSWSMVFWEAARNLERIESARKQADAYPLRQTTDSARKWVTSTKVGSFSARLFKSCFSISSAFLHNQGSDTHGASNRDAENTDFHKVGNVDAMLKVGWNRVDYTPPLTSPVRWLWLAGSLRVTDTVNDPSVGDIRKDSKGYSERGRRRRQKSTRE